MKKKIIKKVLNEEELLEEANLFASFLQPGSIISLKGELGAGKTTFVKGVAQKLKIKKPITSPTYTIIKEYDQKLCHIDAYRIQDEDIGLDYYLEQGYFIFIEWADNLDLSNFNLNYEIKINYLEQGREIEIYEYN